MKTSEKDTRTAVDPKTPQPNPPGIPRSDLSCQTVKSTEEIMADECERLGIPIIRHLLVPQGIGWREIFFGTSHTTKIGEKDE